MWGEVRDGAWDGLTRSASSLLSEGALFSPTSTCQTQTWNHDADVGFRVDWMLGPTQTWLGPGADVAPGPGGHKRRAALRSVA